MLCVDLRFTQPSALSGSLVADELDACPPATEDPAFAPAVPEEVAAVAEPSLASESPDVVPAAGSWLP